MISREEAGRIATAYLKAAFASPKGLVSANVRRSHEPTVEVVRDLSEASRPPRPYLSSDAGVADCWIAYLTSRLLALQASQIVLVSKESGEVLYFGSAHDEG
jgi:hypothetical protein